jgi:2-hydroxychromene-2-carboxylate isomerase
VKTITFFLDFISPFAYLAFEEFPKTLAGLSYAVRYKPVFFGGLLQHNGQMGPAELQHKREWTYRHTQWLAQGKGIPFAMPAMHPFNPLPLLRLAVATDRLGEPNRYVCETIFRHVWIGGADAADAARTAALSEALQAGRSLYMDAPAAKELLTQHTKDAIAAGVFGVPSYAVDDRVFWGLDALPMLRAYLEDDPSLAAAQWQAVADVPYGIARRKAP